MSAADPVGVFDSGVGGLSVLRAIRQELPHEHLLYVGDSGCAPYGDRAAAFVTERAAAMTQFLVEKGAKAVVVACNTATAIAVESLRARFAVPIIAIEPAVKPAAFRTRSRIVGVLATTGTLSSPNMAKLLANYGSDVEVLIQACPGLACQVEKGELASEETRLLVKRYVRPLTDKGADILVLGCTHYPFLRPLIQEIAGPGVDVIDPATAVARELRRRLENADLLRAGAEPGTERFWTTGALEAVASTMEQLWERPVQLLPLQRSLRGSAMNLCLFGLSIVSVAVGLTAAVQGQVDLKTVDGHVKAAEAAAEEEYRALFTQLCAAPAPLAARQGQPPAAGSPGQGQPAPPDRSTWYAEPVKVFDNLYFLGQSEYSVWAVTTSQGIILVDTIFGYSVEAEVVEGLKKLGLDPAQIKYAIVSHGHSDHSGGAKYLQERFGTRILVSAADWDLLERSAEPKPKRDMVITDGMNLTLGDTTLTMYLTPGHTLGTVSTLIPVRDNGKPHVAALWGGTLFNWLRGSAAYITLATPSSYWFEHYIASASKFRQVAAKSGADVLLSNHTLFDGSRTRLPAVRARKPGEPHPYVVSNASVTRFLTMAEECAKAGLLRSRQ